MDVQKKRKRRNRKNDLVVYYVDSVVYYVDCCRCNYFVIVVEKYFHCDDNR